jgi:glycosyltransferase involved in cell wall biosynthesis
MSEILGKTETGIRLSPGDSPALAQAIERLVNDEAYYQKISQNART